MKIFPDDILSKELADFKLIIDANLISKNKIF